MPVPFTSSTPQWDSSAHTLRDYLWHLEHLLKMAKVTNDAEQLKWAVAYVNANIQDQWMNLTEYKDNKWKEFRERLVEEYPELVAEQEGSVNSLRLLCLRFDGITIHQLSRLLEFKREFMAVADKCLAPPALVHNRELVTLFRETLSSEFQDTLQSRLSITGTIKVDRNGKSRQEDPFELSEVVKHAVNLASKAAQMGLLGKSYCKASESQSRSTQPKIETDSRAHIPISCEQAVHGNEPKLDVDAIHCEINELKTSIQATQRNMQSYFDSLKSMYTKQQAPASSRQQPMGMNIPTPADRPCYYCDQNGHRWMECPEKVQDEKSGLIKCEGTKIRFADRSGIPMLQGMCICECIRKFLPQGLSNMFFGPPDLPQDNEPDTGSVSILS
ncbi:hypothetical protein AN958_09436 [Leucoagaricus sp. SymC.cos]|nr:hypothetical protein AN958_09436 [Leucoagaricus sp. SymC.cos]